VTKTLIKYNVTPLRTLEIVSHADLDARDFDERGNYKFPHAVALTQAWRFVSQPLLTETLSEQLTMRATPSVEELDEADVQRVLPLNAEPLVLTELPSLAWMRRLNELLRPTTGPRPSYATYSVERSAQNAASTYALRFGKQNIFQDRPCRGRHGAARGRESACACRSAQ